MLTAFAQQISIGSAAGPSAALAVDIRHVFAYNVRVLRPKTPSISTLQYSCGFTLPGGRVTLWSFRRNPEEISG